MDIACNAFLNLIFSLIKHPTLRVILRPQLPGEKFAFYFGDPSTPIPCTICGPIPLPSREASAVQQPLGHRLMPRIRTN